MPYKWHIQAYIFYDRHQKYLVDNQYTADSFRDPQRLFKPVNCHSSTRLQFSCPDLRFVFAAEVAEFYNEQLLRQGVSSKIEPDTTTL